MMAKRRNHPKPISSNERVRNLISGFLDHAMSLQSDSSPNAGLARTMLKGGWRLHGGVGLVTDAKLRSDQQNLTNQIRRQLGVDGPDEREIDLILWNEIVKLVRGGSFSQPRHTLRASVSSVSQEIDGRSKEQHVLFFKNPAMREFSSKVPITLGPVSIVDIGTFRADLEALDANFPIQPQWDSAAVWRVETVCAPSKARNQAKWFIDITCGLLAVCNEDRMPFDIFRVGWHMFHPTEVRETFLEELGLSSGRLFGGNSTSHYQFVLSPSFLEFLRSEQFQLKVNSLFVSSADTVGARVAVSLGWLARGLQASQLENRLLFFSTALEAILVDGEGIADQLARHGACILTDDIQERVTYSGLLREAYDYRSRLVHSGDRAIHRIDVNNLEFLALGIVREIWLKADLSMLFKDFVKLLKKSAFGTPMPWVARKGRDV